MRFKKGSKVEVFSNEAPSGAWRCAEIISGNGHNYNVKYACSSGLTGKSDIERVLRKEIRPCPPPMSGVESWVAGDMVEVFENFSWKAARVIKAMGGSHYLVRLLCSSQELQVHKTNCRMFQSWGNDEWVALGKGSGNFEGQKRNSMSTLDSHQKMVFLSPQADAKLEGQGGYNRLAVQKSIGFPESNIVSSRTLKRALPFCTSYAEEYPGNDRKLRAIEREGQLEQLISGYAASSPEKVDAVACPRENLGEKYMHAPSNIAANGYYDMGRTKSNYIIDWSHIRSSESCDSDIACSVGSCSVSSNGPSKLSGCPLAGPSPEADYFSSDAESFCGYEVEENSPRVVGGDVAEKIHRLELHAYRCTLEALFAFGSLSWEQEALLTNLRISLNISNDEHLMEIRNLISAGSC